MAIVRSILATSTKTQIATSVITSAAFTPADGSLLVAIVASVGADLAPVSSITDSAGLTWTKRLERIQTDARCSHMTIWTAPVVTGVLMTISADTGDGISSTSAEVLTILGMTGHDPATPIKQVFQAGISEFRSGAYAGALGAAPLVNSLVIAACCSDMASWTGATYDIGAGWTQLFEAGQGNGGCLVEERGASVSTAIAFAALGSSFSWIAAAIEIAAAAAGGSSGGTKHSEYLKAQATG